MYVIKSGPLFFVKDLEAPRFSTEYPDALLFSRVPKNVGITLSDKVTPLEIIKDYGLDSEQVVWAFAK